VGEIFRNPDQARTIELIATTKGEAFYQGELAQRMASVSARDGGVLSLKDLSEHTPIEAAPLNVTLGGAQVHELPPNGQGLAALVAMGIVERLDLVGADPDDPATIHLHIEAMKIGFEDAFRIVADPDHLIEDPALVLSDAALSARADAIDADTGRDVVFPWPQWSSTVYLATADSDGNAVSFIQSNFEGFGSGVVIDGTGIAMQNRATGFLPQADHPGTIQGGHRPFHTIIPGFITRNGATDMAFGVMGGPMQAQGHLQVATRCLLAGQNPQEALDAPRWRIFDERRVEVEPGTSQSIIDGLTQRGHRIVEAESRTVRFGGGQAVQRRGECWLAASDSRRDGQAVGF
jgi:gamma-glutamyltranspeptidase/glutathione hydrolase